MPEEGMDWYKHHPADFVIGTLHMTTEAVGAYILLLAYQWDKTRIPMDERKLAKITRLSIKRLRRVWSEFLVEKFKEDEEGYFNSRLERERLAAEEVSESKRRGAYASHVQRSCKPDAHAESVDTTSTRARARRASDLSSLSSPSGREGEGGGQGNNGSEFPHPLDTPAFHAKWAEWIESRRERRKPVTPRAAKMQLAKLARAGLQVAMAAIDQAIENDWQGLFPEKVRGAGSRPNRHSRTDDESSFAGSPGWEDAT